MKAEAKSLRFLGEGKEISVPFFQRRYVWSESNWKELLASFEDDSVIPFLGSIILKDEGKSNYTVIDGQQRLTTVTILAKAVYDTLPVTSKQAGSGIRNCIENFLFFRKNAADDFKDSCIKIRHSKNDHKDYETVIGAETLNDQAIDIDTINDSSSCVLQCYKYYRERLKNYSEKQLRRLFSSLFEEDRRVLVVIELEMGDINEQTIFDTINRAGVRLSTADIVKNNLYKHLLAKSGDDESKKKLVINTYDDCWEAVFCSTQAQNEMWDEERVFGNVKHNNLEFLLYCIACIKWGEDCDMFANLALVFEREVAQMGFAELLALAKEIKVYAGIFKKYILDFKAELEDEQKSVYIKYEDHINRLLLILQKFKVQMFYPYVLKRIYEVDQADADAALLEDFKKLESFIVRRKISPRGTHDYTSKCYQIIKNGIDALIESDFANADGKISDVEVKQYLNNTKDDAARMILFCIELYRRRSAAVDVKALEYTYTLEHIMPRKWDSDWSVVPIIENGTTLLPNSPEGIQFRNNAVQSLGNKTLLTTNLNSSVKNASFLKKIVGDGDHKPGYEGLTSLFITQEVISQSKKDPIWDEAHIFARCDTLFKEFLEIWPSYVPTKRALAATDDTDPDLSQYTEEQLADPSILLSAVPLNTTVSGTSHADMVTLNEFKTMVTVQPETIDSYIRDGRIVPDAINASGGPKVKLFCLGTIQAYAQQFGWKIIDDTNRKAIFIKMVQEMEMSYSYKPVLLKAMLDCVADDGVAELNQIVLYFLKYYSSRHKAGVLVEKANSVFANAECSFKDAQRVILTYPFDRFRTMQALFLDGEKTKMAFNKNLWNQLTCEDKALIIEICDQKLEKYYA